MNKDIKKFIDVYFNVITEAWDRYLYRDVIMAVGLATNYGKDPWVKGESGRKVLQKIKELAFHTKGGKLVSTTNVSDDDDIYTSGNRYAGSSLFDGGYIYNYWKFRAQKGDEYGKNTFELIHSIDPYGNQTKPRDVLATEVGLVSYAIWKAMNSKATKIENNEKEVADKKLDELYISGSKIENKKFIIKDIYTDVYQYSRWSNSKSTGVLVGEDPETGIKVKLKVTSGTGLKLYNVLQRARSKNVLDKIVPIEIVVEKATISKFDIKWKTVVFSRVALLSPTESEIEDLLNKVYDLDKNIKKEEIKQEVKNQVEQLEDDKIRKMIQSFFDGLKDDSNKKEKIINAFEGIKALEKDGMIAGFNSKLFLNIFKEIYKNEIGEDFEE